MLNGNFNKLLYDTHFIYKIYNFGDFNHINNE